MPVRRRAWLSREGVYFLGVLAFIIGGAILRSFNLLVVLAGMMIAALLLNWRIVMATLWGLAVERTLPAQITAGEPLTVELKIHNNRRSLGAWLVTVEDWVERLGDFAPGWHATHSWWHRIRTLLGWNRARGEALAAEVAAGGVATATYRITLARRGHYRFGPLRVSTRFPLGLVWGHFELEDWAELIVAPRIGRLSRQWVALLEAELAGDQRRHPQRGVAEGDYYGLRPWQSGDSTRWIHWRSTAKLGRPTVLQFERQRNRDVALILDPWLPANPAPQDVGHLELAVCLAATAVVDLTSRGQARLVFAVAGHSPDCWSGPASPLFCEELLRELATLPGSAESSLSGLLERVRDEAPRGVRTIIISPRQPQVAADPERDNLAWIDVSQPELAELFTLDA
jgi:uncharacterized protein (DUF58 family)